MAAWVSRNSWIRSVAWDIPWSEDAELSEYICQENNVFLIDLTDDFGNRFFERAEVEPDWPE